MIDPTKPQGAFHQKKMQDEVSSALVLNAVFITGQSKYAVINGKQYRVADFVQGNKVILISQNQVILNTDSGEKTLFINNHNIKKDINNGF